MTMRTQFDETKAQTVHHALECVNDDLGCIRRLLGKPDVCMSAPEVMDVIRMAVDRVHYRYECMATEQRFKFGAVIAERERCLNIVRREAEGWDKATLEHDMCERIEAAIEGRPGRTGSVLE